MLRNPPPNYIIKNNHIIINPDGKKNLEKTKAFFEDLTNVKKVIKNFVFFGADGLPGWFLENNKALFENLLRDSVYTYKGENQFKYSTHSWPNWASLYSGVSPTDFGYVHPENNVVPKHKSKYSSYLGRPNNFLNSFNNTYSQNNLWSFACFYPNLLKSLVNPTLKKQFKHSSYSQEQANIHNYFKKISKTNDTKKRLINIMWGATDSGMDGETKRNVLFGTESALNQVIIMQNTLEDIKLQLIKKKMWNETMIVIVSDHGGLPGTVSHGLGSASEKDVHYLSQVPIVFLGGGIKGRNVFTDQLNNIQIASTIANIMKFKKSSYWSPAINFNKIKDFK